MTKLIIMFAVSADTQWRVNPMGAVQFVGRLHPGLRKLTKTANLRYFWPSLNTLKLQKNKNNVKSRN